MIQCPQSDFTIPCPEIFYCCASAGQRCGQKQGNREAVRDTVGFWFSLHDHFAVGHKISGGCKHLFSCSWVFRLTVDGLKLAWMGSSVSGCQPPSAGCLSWAPPCYGLGPHLLLWGPGWRWAPVQGQEEAVHVQLPFQSPPSPRPLRSSSRCSSQVKLGRPSL